MTNEQRVISFLEKILNKLISIDTNISRLQKQITKMQNESKRIDMIDQPSETALDVEGGR